MKLREHWATWPRWRRTLILAILGALLFSCSLCGIITQCAPDSGDTRVATLPLTPDVPSSTNTLFSAPSFTPAATHTPVPSSTRAPTASPSHTAMPTLTATTAPSATEAPTQAPTSTRTLAPASTRTLAPTVTTVPTPDGGGTVYIAAKGAKYHKASCQYVKAGATPVTCEWAKANGYTPCSVCHPSCP